MEPLRGIDALFVRDGPAFVPTELCRGPWSPHAQHGGPPAALLADALASHEDGAEHHLARCTIELWRPVPLVPLRVTTHFLRPGRKAQWVEASLFAGKVEVARAVGLRIRRAALDLPAGSPRPAPPPFDSVGAFRPPDGGWRPSFHLDAVEHRFVTGAFGEIGPATDWIRLRVPVIAGEPTTPSMRVAAAADFGNGVSAMLPRDGGYRFINPDLTLHVHRWPSGEWVCIEAATAVESHGVGLAESRLWDERGPLGRSLQSLVLERPRDDE